MSRNQKSPTWPFLVILTCLFVLNVMAPRGWERVARKHAADASVAAGGRERRVAEIPAPPPTGRPTLAPPRTHATFGDHAVSAKLMLAAVRPSVARSAAVPSVDSSVKPLEARKSGDASERGVAAGESKVARPRSEAGPALAPGDSMRVAIVPAYSPSPIDRQTKIDAETFRVPLIQLAPAEAPIVAPPIVTESAIGDASASSGRVSECWMIEPESLLARLDALAWDCDCGEWALEVARRIEALRDVDLSAERSEQILDELRTLAASANSITMSMVDGDLIVEVRRVAHAVERRVDVWCSAAKLDAPAVQALRIVPEPESLGRRVCDSLALIGESAAGRAWSDYLMLESLRELSAARLARMADSPAELARRVLDRLNRTSLSVEQRRLVGAVELSDLAEELRQWAASPVSPRELLASVERFETSRLASDARGLADVYRKLAYSPLEIDQSLAERLDTHYRNANLRLALTSDLINRLVPGAQEMRQPVRETILGLPTIGWSDTSTKVAVRLVPDATRLRFALAADGVILADTRTTSGPVTVFSRANSNFHAERLVEFGPWGITAGPVSVEAAINPRLRGLRTDFDGVPLVGAMVREIALDQHRQKTPLALAESRAKVTRQVEARVTTETEAALERANRDWRSRVAEPLLRLGLEPEVVEMTTTNERLTMRVRVAGEHQLAGHAPRPAAPADSVLSVQVHQSLVNNICEQLDLNGHTLSLREFQRKVADALGIKPGEGEDEAPEDLKIAFAEQDGISIRFDQDRIAIVLRVAMLRQGPVTWKDLTVSVFYRLEGDGLEARLVRDGVVQMASPRRLGLHSQVVLRGLFSRIFPADRAVDMIPPAVALNPRMSGLQVTQLEVVEGWVGVAIGPARAEGTPLVARRR